MSSDWEDWEFWIENPDNAEWIDGDVDWEVGDEMFDKGRSLSKQVSDRGLRVLANQGRNVLGVAVGGIVVAVLVAGAWHYRKDIKESLILTFGPIFDAIGKSFNKVVRS
jgi:hypothetical protein